MSTALLLLSGSALPASAQGPLNDSSGQISNAPTETDFILVAGGFHDALALLPPQSLTIAPVLPGDVPASH